jgi:hypothetical protein
MPHDDDAGLITRGEVERMFAAGDREMLATILDLLGAAPAAAAVRKRREQEDEGVDPQFVAARREIAKAIRNPLLSFGDAGFRRGDALHDIPLLGGGEDEDIGPNLRRIRNRPSKRGGGKP